MSVEPNEQLEAMGWSLESARPRAVIDEQWNGGRSPILRYRFTLRRNDRAVIADEYSMGVGRIRPAHWRRTARQPFLLTEEDRRLARDMANHPGRVPVDKESWLRAAEITAIHNDIRPDLADVMGALFEDGTAHFDNHSFESWAAELGMDPDSRRAERLFNTCVDYGRSLARACPSEELRCLREILCG